MVIVKEATLGNKKMRIITDESPESPREWDNLGKMVCFHRRYNLGDKHELTVDELKALIRRKDVISLPLFLYDHSGLSMSTNRNYPFNDRWDSMQVGYIYITFEDIRKAYGIKRLTSKLIDKVINVLVSEVETYNLYLHGEVYGFEIVELKTCNLGHEHEETLDSCFGFYGSNFEDNGIFDYAGEEWKNAQWVEHD